MEDQDNQDEHDELRSHTPNTMSVDEADYLKNDLETSDSPGDSSPVKELNSVSFHEQKWSRLHRHYNDQYLELFRTTLGDADEEMSGEDLFTTQLGAVVWQPSEKAALYNGLCRKGRRDLQGLSGLIGTKSEVEVKAYLDSLQEQEIDRQRFEPQTKNVSHADIPAAIEIGSEVEPLLDQAADALAAFQEQFDHAAGQRNTTLWLIDQATASDLDQKADEAEAARDLSDQGSGDEDESDSEATSLFHLSAFLTLAEEYFMNQGSDGSYNWRNLAEEGQRPAMTMDVVTTVFDLVVNFTRKLIQSCLFVAQSRIRASTSVKKHEPLRLVKYDDVAAALSILNVKNNADTFWVGMARRNNLSVVDYSSRKDNSRGTIMSYEDVESRLSIPSRRRSMSTASDDSIRGRATSIEPVRHSELEDDAEGSSDTEDDAIAAPTEEGASTGEESDDEDSRTSDEQSRSSSSEDETRPNPPVSRQKRILLLEEEQDAYMERMDQEARKLEESRLLQLLGAHVEDQIKSEESPDLGPRPRVMRKTVEECIGWSVQYQAEWELLGEMLPPGSFSAVRSGAKRRRLEPKAVLDLPAP
ncbi:hypothetical protein A1O3_02088 [Capronia epimyces CBS 606.96]|uniref:Myb-like domain-containing protein n=1 Tax=Capronia epimyces CBS 606.96 TaxID=1182542 RepID=W9Z3E8_9EURO|nr:uncharacterized protein A1O3_02088 [Capronia epimyces CBS 606.96]EXJ89024.1 hypothetical protein A1O3_02088 [Capronia epimyces CBS 606.96]